MLIIFRKLTAFNMTAIVNTTIKLLCNLNYRLLAPCRNIHMSSASYLYSYSALGIDNYTQTRKRTKEQFTNFTEKFKTKMSNFVSDDKNLIFTEDLKNMVHLAEPSDLDLVRDMVKKFNTQSSEFRFGSFIFGPVVMRMFYFLDAPDYALKCFEDPLNDGFFDQLVSYQILLDLLYNHQRYEEMYKVFEKVKEKQLHMSKYPKYPVVLIMAACYKQNTPESYEYAFKLWNEMTSAGTVPLRRSTTLFAALALKQGKPHAALEAIASQKPHYVTIRNVKVSALADLGRVDDTFPILKGVLDVDAPGPSKHTFFEETMVKVTAAVQKSNNKDLEKEFANIEKALRDRDLIENKTLDQLLSTEIALNPRNTDTSRTPNFHKKRLPFGLRNKDQLV